MVDGSYWTLTIELLFYAYIGFFTWLFSTRRLEWFYDGWLFISLAVFFFHVDGFIISKLLLVRYASFFIFGGTIALLLETWKTSAPWRRIRLIVVLIISALAPLYISYILQQEYSTFTNYFGVLTAYSALIVESFFILVPLALYMSRHISKGKLFTLAKILGGITYPLYLLHQRLGSIIIEKFGVFGLVSIYSVLTACGMIIVSYFISQYEEKSRKKLFKKLVTVKSTQVT
jgi:peptidoglycan/LPS O-acetylase OafA/YrhL